MEGVSVTSSKDWFETICKALGEMQAEHRMRGELLRVVYQLVDCMPTNLPDRIRKMVTEHSRIEDSKKLREENARLNLEVGSLITENRATRTHAEAAVGAAERIQMFVHQAGKVVVKAELFDVKVGIRSKPSGTRIAFILTGYLENLERVLADMREVVNRVTDLRR
jgi:ribosomal protein L27